MIFKSVRNRRVTIAYVSFIRYTLTCIWSMIWSGDGISSGYSRILSDFVKYKSSTIDSGKSLLICITSQWVNRSSHVFFRLSQYNLDLPNIDECKIGQILHSYAIRKIPGTIIQIDGSVHGQSKYLKWKFHTYSISRKIFAGGYSRPYSVISKSQIDRTTSN